MISPNWRRGIGSCGSLCPLRASSWGGPLAILFRAAFFEGDNIHFELTASRQLVVGLIALLILLNTYVVTRRLELRRVREKLISSTIQGELARQQSFTDPLTELYNRRSLEDMAARFMSHASDNSRVIGIS